MSQTTFETFIKDTWVAGWVARGFLSERVPAAANPFAVGRNPSRGYSRSRHAHQRDCPARARPPDSARDVMASSDEEIGCGRADGRPPAAMAPQAAGARGHFSAPDLLAVARVAERLSQGSA